MAEIRKILTAKRPQVSKLTQPLHFERHRFEDYLSSSYMRKFLGLLTERRADGTCYLEKVFSTYDRPYASLGERLKYSLPHHVIEMFAPKRGWIRKS